MYCIGVLHYTSIHCTVECWTLRSTATRTASAAVSESEVFSSEVVSTGWAPTTSKGLLLESGSIYIKDPFQYFLPDTMGSEHQHLGSASTCLSISEGGIYKIFKLDFFSWLRSCFFSFFFFCQDLVFFFFISWSRSCFLSFFLVESVFSFSFFSKITFFGRKHVFFLFFLKIFLL